MPDNFTRRILITGGTGFVGSTLTRLLESEGGDCEVMSLGRPPFSQSLDIRDPDAVDVLIHDVRPTALVHLAAVAAPSEAREAPRRAWEVNLTGTMNLAESIRRHTPAARFIYVGSSDAYGASFSDSPGALNENAALQPINVYAATKAAADIMVGQMAYDGLNAIRFRPFNHTGPGQSDTYVVPAFARQVAEIAAGRAEPIVRVGNLDVERDFLDVRDVVRAYAIAALSDMPHEPNLVFNLASGKLYKMRYILDTLIAHSRVPIHVEVDPNKVRANDIPKTQGDATSAREQLGWAPSITFEQTLADVFDYWRAQVDSKGCLGS